MADTPESPPITRGGPDRPRPADHVYGGPAAPRPFRGQAGEDADAAPRPLSPGATASQPDDDGPDIAADDAGASARTETPQRKG